ncbi:MAG: hypothetical protein PHI23_03285 [Candidatus Peribacteraceae bacterium]|nr:hypothetical protein [Candidatus Peribacteraceae bacterium]
MSAKRIFTPEQAKEVGTKIGIAWNDAAFDLEQFRRGMDVELEHGKRDTRTNVTNDDPVLTGKIAWAHLIEFPDYYTRLDVLETEADAYWSTRNK